ncbi:hypothetical protein EGW08_023713, partial [Elysia chlorotica]
EIERKTETLGLFHIESFLKKVCDLTFFSHFISERKIRALKLVTVKMTCHVHKTTKIYCATVIELNEGTEEPSFSASFPQKSGTKYAFNTEEDVGLVIPGPPDFYSWVVLNHKAQAEDHGAQNAPCFF